jgi:hypothetical protein
VYFVRKRDASSSRDEGRPFDQWCPFDQCILFGSGTLPLAGTKGDPSISGPVVIGF